MADCELCGKPQRADTAYVCRACGIDLAGDPNDPRKPGLLNTAADLWPELLTTCAGLARMADPGPHRRGRAPAEPARPGIGGADQTTGWPTGLPPNLAAVEVRDAVRNTVTTWVRHIAAERGTIEPIGTTPTLLRWLAGQVEWARHQPDAAQCLDELGYAASRIAPAVDRPRPRVDAGECGSPTGQGPCRQRLRAAPGAAIVHCPVCRATWSATDRRETILAEARKLMATPEEIATWLTILGNPTQGATVRRWIARRQLIGSGGWYPFDRAVQLRTELWGRRGMCRSAA